MSKWNIDRQNYKWNINELLRLEREYDLLELSVVEIAKLHRRTATAIARKLQYEDIISNYKTARGFMNSTSDNDNRTFSNVVYDNLDYDNSSEYIPSDSDSDFDSDFDSDYSPEYFESYAKKYIQYKNNDTQNHLDSDSDYVKNELSKNYVPSNLNNTNYDSDSDSSVEIIENNNVTQRVDKLETSVSNMEGMLTKMYNFMTSNSSSLNMGYDM